MADDAAPNLGASIGDAIKQQLKQTVENVDIVGILQKIVATSPEDEESEEIREKLQGVLEKYNAMSDEDKVNFVSQMKGLLSSKVAMKLDQTDLNLDELQNAIGEAVMYQLAFLAAGALILVLLFVFFGYKLYKSIKEKEHKREEKKKAKQMKKKK
ncbi:uncharacterized protein LOC113227838 [Hyposmocoma kahamanoa]|uniref:uncharacterized protein LOC113227838 n=1 Tax=Hyposmocoma kahamanoa TaxID=1477025 RepID=UPI000E6D841B|nr:uncharacterized protein LOC113227838 [Hyposmocoma kahamanoa]